MIYHDAAAHMLTYVWCERTLYTHYIYTKAHSRPAIYDMYVL